MKCNHFSVKGTVSRDFRHFFYQKTSPGLHMNRQKRYSDILERRVSLVNDYADNVSA